MARYDRIAPLKAPDRENAFPSWMALRDLQGRERDPDLGRRARLRFLALRPVRRLLDRGIDNVPVASFERQVEGVREELGHLSARDPERTKLSQFLHRILERTPTALAVATLELGEVIEASGHYYAAMECYLTALELARAYALGPEEVMALRLLGRVNRKTARWAEAERYYRRAIERALEMADRAQWARAMDGLGLCYGYQGNYPKARKIFEEVLERGKSWRDDFVVATAYSSLCYHALTAGDLEAAIEYGWTALGMMPSVEERLPVLGNLGIAFSQLGLHAAAERCYQILGENSKQLIIRGQARSNHALSAAESGNAEEFRARRLRLLQDAEEWRGEPWINSWMHFQLGRGSYLVGDVDATRDHLRTAIRIAEAHGYNELLIRAEELLDALETGLDQAPAPPAPAERAGAATQQIASAMASFELVPVAAGA